MQQLTENECTNALVFLERVDLKGKEAMAHAELTMKIGAIRHTLQNPPAPQKPAETPIEQPLPELNGE